MQEELERRFKEWWDEASETFDCGDACSECYHNYRAAFMAGYAVRPRGEMTSGDNYYEMKWA
jgi:hypothetical protein